ncbi:glycosyltransferase family 4 protein [Polynucleobacter brandtiae]|uniref:glycosyltransferase family 4 protein n=1 Tax=Polynucleobacter brandtiae TaxID=1938816 RepID=UPI001E3DF041|nr:glycosyltransferase family 4 protein [Polynucleobacter brandtiae]
MELEKKNKIQLIVLTDYAYINGGASQVALSSLNYLADSGVDVRLVAAVGPIDASINRDKVLVTCFEGVDLLGDALRFRSAVNGLWNYKHKRNLELILKEYSPVNSVIHIHTWVKSLSSSVIKACIDHGFKVVLTLHDYFLVCPNGGLYNYPKGEHCTVPPMSLSCLSTNCDSRSYAHKLWRYTRQLIQENIAHIPNEVKNYICVSSYSEALVSPYLPEGANVFRIPNPITIKKLPNLPPSLSSSFIYVGRFSPEKGATLFAQAADALKISATFVGLGSEEDRIRTLCPSAKFLGWLDSNGVLGAVKSSRALIFPSICHETQGLTVAESAALGIPAIVSDGCAARELIVDGVTGLLFKSGDLVDLIDKIKMLDENPSFADELGGNAYVKYWGSPSSLEKHVASLLFCYENIIYGSS